jgi:hypothetical protein
MQIKQGTCIGPRDVTTCGQKHSYNSNFGRMLLERNSGSEKPAPLGESRRLATGIGHFQRGNGNPMAAASKILIQLLSLWNLSDRNKIHNAPEVCDVFSGYSANGDVAFNIRLRVPRETNIRHSHTKL